MFVQKLGKHTFPTNTLLLLNLLVRGPEALWQWQLQSPSWNPGPSGDHLLLLWEPPTWCWGPCCYFSFSKANTIHSHCLHFLSSSAHWSLPSHFYIALQRSSHDLSIAKYRLLFSLDFSVAWDHILIELLSSFLFYSPNLWGFFLSPPPPSMSLIPFPSVFCICSPQNALRFQVWSKDKQHQWHPGALIGNAEFRARPSPTESVCVLTGPAPCRQVTHVQIRVWEALL